MRDPVTDPFSELDAASLEAVPPDAEPALEPPPWVAEAEPRRVDTVLEGLDPEQRQAVTHTAGPLLIVAGAGTGKTTVLTRRIAYLIAARLVHPSEILALTFTERAAAEMEARVDLLLPYGFTDTVIGTFHAFGDRVLRDFALDVGLPDNLRVLSEAERIVFVRERLFQLPLKKWLPLQNPTRHLKALLGVISRAKDEGVEPEVYLEAARQAVERAAGGDEAAVDQAARQLEVAQVYRAYQEAMLAAGVIDFGDQILLARRVLRDSPRAREQLQKRFKFILVDEFQDTNVAQFELLKLLAGPEANLTVVGDDDQSIYRFRGAALSNLLGFSKAYPKRELVVLRTNYRSGQGILDAAARLIAYNNPDRLEVQEGIDKRLRASPANPAADPIDLAHHDTLRAECDAVALKIRTWVEAGTFAWRDILLVVRSNRDATPFLQALRAFGVPHQFSGDDGLYQQSEIQMCVAFLRSVARRRDSQSHYAVAASPAYAVPMADLVKLSDFARAEHQSLRQVIERVATSEMLPDGLEELSAADKVCKLAADLGRFTDMAQQSSTGEVLYAFLAESGVLARWMAEASVENEERVRNVTRFFELVSRYAGVARVDRVSAFVDFQELLFEAGDDPRAVEPDQDVDAVRVMTVHRAKGLEFPCVFVSNLVMQKFPTQARRPPIELLPELDSNRDLGEDHHLAEERRLFYVAMTRAERCLCLTGSADHGGTSPRKLSRFVYEALDLVPGAVRPAGRSAAEALARYDAQPPARPLVERQDTRPAGRSVPAPARIAATGVVEFAACPLRFRFSQVMRMPAPVHHSASFGTAVHAAVAQCLTARMRSEAVTVEAAADKFREVWRGEGYLSREHEERRFAEGLALVRRFAEAEAGAPVRPAAVESAFVLRHRGVRIEGRFDRIDLERPGEATIIDYKTGGVAGEEGARRRVRESLQLKLYALAYAAARGAPPRRVELRFLEAGASAAHRVEAADLAEARARVEATVHAIHAATYEPTPAAAVCGPCAYRMVCPSAVSG